MEHVCIFTFTCSMLISVSHGMCKRRHIHVKPRPTKHSCHCHCHVWKALNSWACNLFKSPLKLERQTVQTISFLPAAQFWSENTFRYHACIYIYIYAYIHMCISTTCKSFDWSYVVCNQCISIYLCARALWPWVGPVSTTVGAGFFHQNLPQKGAAD